MTDVRLKDVLSKLPLNDKDREYLFRAITALQTTPTGSTTAPAPTQTVVHTTHHETVSDDRIRAVIDNYVRSLPRLSVITHNAGDLVSGRFIAPAPTSTSAEPTDAAFTGSFVSGLGEEFSSVAYNVGGATGGVLQWGARQDNGKLIAGAGNVQLSNSGIVLLEGGSGQSFLSFYNSAGTVEQYAFKVATGAMQIQSLLAGGLFSFLLKLTDGSTPYFKWYENPGVTNATLFEVQPGDAGGRVSFGSDHFIDFLNSAGTGSATVYFNERNKDVDFQVESANSAAALKVDASLDQAQLGAQVALTGDISPSTLTAHQNDYNPTGLSTASVLRLITDGSNYNITGLAGGSDGRIIIIRTLTGSGVITLKNESASSTAANRFALTRDIPILSGRAVVLQYDSTISRWRDLATTDATSLQGVFVSSGLSGTVGDGDILIYNAGDTSFEDVSPADYIGLYATEAVQDVVGGMVSGNSESGITVTYDDTNGKLDFSVSGGGLTSGPQAFGDNYVITPSVASSNLTVALKTVAGSDPSGGDPITVRIGNTKQTISAALSTTKNAGTNWCNAGGTEMAANAIDFFVYVIQETGASAGTKIGFSRIPYARTMGDFVNTSTSEKYIAGSWTNFNSTDAVEVIGRFRAQLSAAAGHNWSIATALVVNRPIYETDWLTWSPSVTAFSSNPTFITRYKLLSELLHVGYAQSAAATSNSTSFLVTMPFIAKNVTNYFQYSALPHVVNNGTTEAVGLVWATPNSNELTLRRSAAATWTNSGNKNASFNIAIEIN